MHPTRMTATANGTLVCPVNYASNDFKATVSVEEVGGSAVAMALEFTCDQLGDAAHQGFTTRWQVVPTEWETSVADLWAIPTPVCGVRLNITDIGTATSVILKVVQGHY